MMFLRELFLRAIVFFVFISVASAAIRTVLDIQNELMEKSTSHPTARIIQGRLALDGEFPYMVRITIYGGLLLPIIVGWCGGSIIAKDWIVTAGHCVTQTDLFTDFQAWYIEAGSVIANEPRQDTSLLFIDAYPHPAFNPSTLLNDIALLHSGDFVLDGTYVAAIPLIPNNLNFNSLTGTLMTVCGFGLTSDNGETSKELRTTQMRIITFASCQATYVNDTLPSTCFCADSTQTPRNAVCNGDSGGPVTTRRGNTVYLIGVVSFGSDQGCDTAPNGFTNVQLFTTWITNTMSANS
ncbi:serine protease 3-like [Lutzomyia longipalpis]|uniref:serine protease 3-like n=1 Tax=Lutzomyia longipalpis TaxID=7200 RepID=UPI0024841218|nr:serine protease 3-like [Lutzomyia longipalpis]